MGLFMQKRFKEGFVFWSFVFLSGLGRFLLDFYRDDIRYYGLSTGQYLSLVMIVISVAVFYRYYRDDLKELLRRST